MTNAPIPNRVIYFSGNSGGRFNEYEAIVIDHAESRNDGPSSVTKKPGRSPHLMKVGFQKEKERTTGIE